MRGTRLRAAAFGFATLASTLPAAAQPAPAQPAPEERKTHCFYVTQFENWRASDPKTMYIRVSLNRYYRIDMAAACQQLTWPGAHLITVWRSSGSVCRAIDWDLKVSTDIGGIASPCIVKDMTELTPEEAAAIPPKFKP